MAIRRLTALAIAGALAITACSGDDDGAPGTAPSSDPTDPSTTGPGGAVNVPVFDDGGDAGTGTQEGGAQLGLRLTDGTPEAVEEPLPPPVVEGVALTVEEIAAVLDRLGEWDVPPDDVVDFNRPPESLAPPLVGDRLDAPFPPDPGAPPPGDPAPDGPLDVLRFQPEGEVDVAPFLAVTFDQPMVPLATLEQLDDADVPLVVEPAVEGRWRWIGTRTLRFEVIPDTTTGIDRLPAATEYTVTVPAGTTSANGAVLADEVTWTFRTPPPTVVGLSGASDSMGLDPVFVVEFDQRVDADSVLAAIDLRAGDVDEVRPATAEDLEREPNVRRRLERALPERAHAFVPVSALTPDTPVSFAVDTGVRSLEGPLVSEESSSISGQTYGPLEIEDTDCGFDDCRPFSAFEIEFTNALDRDLFDPALVRVEPAVPGLRVDLAGRRLTLRGATSGETEYVVTVSAQLTDVFGQTLGDDETARFEVGRARPFLSGPDERFVTVDPFADRATLGYTTVNHDELQVTAWAVAPADVREFEEYLDETFRDALADDPPWDQVLDTRVATGASPDVITETAVDLTDAFAAAGGGPIAIRVQPVPAPDPDDDDWFRNRPRYTLVQRTTLGVDAFVGTDEISIWTTDLMTGDPVGGVDVELLGPGNRVTTDGDGLARVPLSGAVFGLVARDGDRTALLPSSWFDGWTADPRRADTLWYTLTDRGVYRPGETVRVAGFVRELTADDAQLALLGGTVAWSAFDPQGNEIGAGSAQVNALGGFNLAIEVPEESNTGPAFVDLRLGSDSTGVGFEVQDFRTPEFEVVARPETEGPYYVVEPATVAVDADYFSGGPLPDAEVNWLVTTQDSTYSPPNWDEFSFGVWIPWWFGFDEGGFVADEVASDVAFEECVEFDCGPGVPFDDPRVQEFTGRTDASGTHYLRIDFADTPASNDPDDDSLVDQPTTVTAEATVFDVNRQAFSSRTSLLVHPAQFYVGLRTERAFVRQGEPLEVDAVVTDVDGDAIAGRTVRLEAGRLDSRWVGGRYVEELVDVQTCEITSTDAVTNDAPDPTMRCDFATELGGQYRITAVVTDDDGRSNRAEITQWVSGSTAPPSRELERGEVTIVPDREEYAPGDTAELLVQAPFAPATALVTVTRAGVESQTVVAAPDGSAVVEVPIADDDVPSLRVRVDMVGSAERTADDGTALPDAPRQPAFAVGAITLPIPPVSRTLDVFATPAEPEAVPGAETSVTVTVNDADGQPVPDAGVVLVVVDEAVLSLTSFDIADPIATMYRGVGIRLDAELLRESIVLADPDLLAAGDDALAGGGDGAEEFEEAAEAPADVAADDGGASRSASTGQAVAIDVRTDFDALAVFAPEETTGADGSVTVPFELPDNLTRYRVTAVAVDGADRFGSGESALTARLPIQVRPSAPRFLNFGDRFELPVVVQNQTGEDVTVDVALQTANLGLVDGLGDGGDVAGQRVIVPADDRIEVRFDAAAAEVGTARFRVAAVAVDDPAQADAAAIELPVYTPATAEAFATYGVLDDENPVLQPVLSPEGVFEQFGGLEISTSSTALQALTDAVLYLYEYRYDSSDGLASRIMAVAALRDVLDAFDAAGLPDAAELDAAVARDLARLAQLQNDDGGFPYWQRGRPSQPWNTVQVTHALVLGAANGYDVDEFTLSFALDHVREIEQYMPSWYTQPTRDAISAYALYVRDLAGETDPGKALDLYRTGERLQMDSLAFLWPVLDDEVARDEIERAIENAAVETAGAATFATSYGEDAYLIAHSDRRTDGIVLGALVSETPASDLVPKVVAGLLGNQTRGRWNNAHENSFILLALNDYFDTFEAVDPDFVARAWLGDTYAAEAEFRGRSTDTFLSTVPMSELVATATDDDGSAPLIVAKEGDGRLYYRLGLRYAPDDLQLDARDEGFVVERVYEAVDDPGDVIRRDDGSWEIAAGAAVRVRLTMVADARRTHVALLDPMAGGFEAVNPAFATSVTVPLSESEARTGYWWWTWYEHQNLRDDRAEAFTSYLPAGTFEYTYVVRATTPGDFVVPPTRAEEIYAPEVFGRGASDRVVITG